jgi:hypothetical protein
MMKFAGVLFIMRLLMFGYDLIVCEKSVFFNEKMVNFVRKNKTGTV